MNASKHLKAGFYTVFLVGFVFLLFGSVSAFFCPDSINVFLSYDNDSQSILNDSGAGFIPLPEAVSYEGVMYRNANSLYGNCYYPSSQIPSNWTRTPVWDLVVVLLNETRIQISSVDLASGEYSAVGDFNGDYSFGPEGEFSLLVEANEPYASGSASKGILNVKISPPESAPEILEVSLEPDYFNIFKPKTRGDMNGDGLLNNQDISKFVTYLSSSESGELSNLGDMNGDGLLNNQDISAFVLASTNPIVYSEQYPGLSSFNDYKLSYSDVFEKTQVVCNVLIKDANRYDDVIEVNYSVKIVPLFEDENRQLEFSGVASCQNNKNCSINVSDAGLIPEKIYPSDRLVCNVYAIDSTNLVSEIKKSNEVKIPSFDLKIREIKALNVVDGTDLIAKKPYMARVWAVFDSDLINVMDREVKVSLDVSDKNYSKRYENCTYVAPNYPSLTILKNNLDSTFLGVCSRDIMKKIKNSEDSVNFLNLENLPTSGNYLFNASVSVNGCGQSVKEENLDNNLNSYSKATILQTKKFNIGYVFVDFDTSAKVIIFPETVQVLNKAVNEQYGSALTILPLSSEMTKFSKPSWPDKRIHPVTKDMMLPEFIYYPYDRAKLLTNDESSKRYAEKLRTNILSQLEKYRQTLGFDFLFGYILDEKIMQGAQELTGQTTVGSRTAILAMPLSGGQISNSYQTPAFVHEMGHAIGKINYEEYSVDDSIAGIAVDEAGWCLNQISEVCGNPMHGNSRVNIWTENKQGLNGLSILTEDIPEYDMRLRLNPRNIMGMRFLNIMGQAEAPYYWIDKETYNKLLNGIGGYFSR